MKKLINTVSERIVNIVIRKCAEHDPYGEKWLSHILHIYEHNSCNYIRFNIFPKETKGFTASVVQTNSYQGEFAIILQGPVLEKDNFTLETVRLYKIIFPKAYIIVSTWDNTSLEVVRKLEDEGAIVVLNKSFHPNGFGNVNYQIITSLSGAKKAQELGALYTLKTRTDWRIYREHALEYLKSLLEHFPVESNNLCNLKGRIICGGGHRANFCMPLWLQDFVYFGFTSDIINFFSIPLDEREIVDRFAYSRTVMGEHSNDGNLLMTLPPPEIYIASHFLEKYVKFPYTLQSHWDNYKKYFMVINPEDLKSLWLKYDRYNNLSLGDFYKGRNQNDACRVMTFQDWLNIYSGHYVYRCDYERIREDRHA